jgi:hypothetical protein
MKAKNENDLVEVYSTSSLEAKMVKSFLEDSEIKAFLKDEIMGTLAPWHTSPGGAGAVKVIVRRKDYEKAKQIIGEYEKNKQ